MKHSSRRRALSGTEMRAQFRCAPHAARRGGTEMRARSSRALHTQPGSEVWCTRVVQVRSTRSRAASSAILRYAAHTHSATSSYSWPCRCTAQPQTLPQTRAAAAVLSARLERYAASRATACTRRTTAIWHIAQQHQHCPTDYPLAQPVRATDRTLTQPCAQRCSAHSPPQERTHTWPPGRGHLQPAPPPQAQASPSLGSLLLTRPPP